MFKYVIQQTQHKIGFVLISFLWNLKTMLKNNNRTNFWLKMENKVTKEISLLFLQHFYDIWKPFL